MVENETIEEFRTSELETTNELIEPSERVHQEEIITNKLKDCSHSDMNRIIKMMNMIARYNKIRRQYTNFCKAFDGNKMYLDWV